MATTGFWPVKSSLKSVIDYADNPDKTTEKKYLDDDLYAALRYAENDDKTDQRIYVAGINCSAECAYQEMSAVQKRYGKQTGNIAYHGYQSFKTGEVTPEEAFEIGKETARRMWGDKYQVLVTVHLNTDNLHCHFVVNAVSFIDGSKFPNKRADHIKLREISDDICRERGKSILESSDFYRNGKKEYWIHKTGQKTHRDLLREDVEYCASIAMDFREFCYELRAFGYEIDTIRMSVKAPEWNRAIRLDRLGFTKESLWKQFDENLMSADGSFKWNNRRFAKIKHFPLANEIRRLSFAVEHEYDPASVLIDTLFLILITVIQLAMEVPDVLLLSPSLRHEVKDIKNHVSDFNLLKKEGIRTVPELESDINNTRAEIEKLERSRTLADNRRRRAHTPEEKAEAKQERRILSKQIAPLRQKLKKEERILEKSPHIYELLKTELKLEKDKIRQLERNRTR